MKRERYAADLLTVLHDIDDVKGRICANCQFYTSWSVGRHCQLKMMPAGPDDGCDRWRPAKVSAYGINFVRR